MVMGGTDNKTLLITVASEASGHMGVASGGGARGGTPDGKKEQEEDKKDKKKSLNKLIGIDVSLAAMLKQSQIFTGFLGSVFQLIGMLVDVILAPLAPYLFRLVEIVASWIPKIAQWSEQAVQWAKDGLDHLAEISSKLTGIDVNATDLVSRGFQLVSLSGFGALIGSAFATKVGGIGDWKLKDFFDDVFSNDDILNPIKNSLKTVRGVAGSMLTGFKSLFKAIMGEAIIGIGKRLLAITKPVLKALGIAGLIFSIVITVMDFQRAWDEGEIGKALVELAIAIVVIGVPMLIGLFFGGWVALIAAIGISVLAMFYEYGVDEATKSTIEAYVEDMWDELNDTWNEWFAGKTGFWKFVNAFLLAAQPAQHMDVWAGVILTEDVKQTINEGMRNMVDGIVNGFIDTINSFIRGLIIPIQESWIGQAAKSNPLLNIGGWLDKDYQLIPHQDFSNWTPMLGSDTPAVYDVRNNPPPGGTYSYENPSAFTGSGPWG